MKIHIIGCSGMGKTYFAKALSKKYKNKVVWISDSREIDRVIEK